MCQIAGGSSQRSKCLRQTGCGHMVALAGIACYRLTGFSRLDQGMNDPESRISSVSRVVSEHPCLTGCALGCGGCLLAGKARYCTCLTVTSTS